MSVIEASIVPATTATEIWNLKLTAHLLESFTLVGEGRTLFIPGAETLIDPMNVFLGYYNFCRSAFKELPSEQISILEYERMLTGVLAKIAQLRRNA